MTHVVEINDLAELPHYRLAWEALWGQTERASFFHTYQWLELFWKHFGATRRFRIMAVRSAGEIVGIVPFCIQRETYRVGHLHVLTLPLADWGFSYGPVGPNPTASWYAAFDRLRKTPRDWDLIDLRWQAAQPTARPRAWAPMQLAGYLPQVRPYQQTSVVDIDRSWDQYLAGRTKHSRHEIRRRLRLDERCSQQVEFSRVRPAGICHGDGDPRWDVFEQCEQLAAQSWQSRSPNGNTLSTRQVRAFLRDCHAAAARLGMLDVTLLRIEGQPTAYGYHYHADGHVLGLRIGYDPKYARLGVGSTLMAHALRDSFARGDQTFDFGIGTQRFKREYRTTVQQSCQLTHYPKAWRPQTLHWARKAKKAVGVGL